MTKLLSIEEKTQLRQYLEDACIRPLIRSILYDKSISLTNSDLITIYTFIYNKCIWDEQRIYCDFFYQYYKQLLTDMCRLLLEQLDDDDQTEQRSSSISVLKIWRQQIQRYLFFAKNLSIMFRILNKHYLLKHQYEDLEKVYRLIWNQNYFRNIYSSLVAYLSNRYVKEKGLDVDHELHLYFQQLYAMDKSTVHSLMEPYFHSLEDYYSLQIHSLETFEYCYQTFQVYYQHEWRILSDFFSIHIDSEREVHSNLRHILLHCYHRTNYPLLTSRLMEAWLFYEKDGTIHPNYSSFIQMFHQMDPDYCVTLYDKWMDELFTAPHIEQLFISYRNTISVDLNPSPFTILFQRKLNQYLSEHESCFSRWMRQIDRYPDDLSMISHIENQERCISEWIHLLYRKCTQFEHTSSTDFIQQQILMIHRLCAVISHPYSRCRLEMLKNDLKQCLYYQQHYHSLREAFFIFSKWEDNEESMGRPQFSTLRLPTELRLYREQMEQAYQSHHENKKLNIHYWKSRVRVDMTYKNNVYPLEMSWVQFAVLCCIAQSSQPISCSELSEALQLQWDQLAPIVHSLTIPPHPMIQKRGNSDTNYLDKDHDRFVFEPSSLPHTSTILCFKMPMHRKKIPLQTTDPLLTQSTLSDREYRYQLQAKIMKTMKQQKQMTLSEIYHLFSNMYDNTLLSDNLKTLVEMEYLEWRDERYFYL